MMRKSPMPLSAAGCYTLDLYCDYMNDDHPWSSMHPGRMWSFTGRTYSECAREARQAGWVIHKDSTATCPMCARKLK